MNLINKCKLNLISNVNENESQVNNTQKSIDSFMDRNIFQNEVIAIHCQLLYALFLANIPFSFVNNPKVIKLFRMLRPSYNLLSRKWISTKILDQVHQEVEYKIQEFVTDAKFLTLSEDGWINVSK